jgi:hypothetical protein
MVRENTQYKTYYLESLSCAFEDGGRRNRGAAGRPIGSAIVGWHRLAERKARWVVADS